MKLILGTMDIKKENMQEIINNAGEIGYEIIDTAWVYKNEKVVGECVANYNSKNNKKLKIQTKVWTPFFSDIKNTLKQQMKDLQLQKIYSVLLHRPSLNFNETINAWKYLIKLQQEGVIEKIGVSNFDKDMIKILIQETGVKPQINQIELSITNFRMDRVFYCLSEGIEVQGWSVMGNNSSSLNNKLCQTLSKKYKVSPATIAISYLTTQKIIPVVKSSTYEHLLANYNSRDICLSKEVIDKLAKENKYDNKFEEIYPY